MAKSSHILQQARTRIDVESYLKWIKLKMNPQYIRASEEMRALKQTESESMERARNVFATFKNIVSREHSPEERNMAENEWREMEKLARRAEGACVDEEERICEKFGIAQWWPPEAILSIEDARFIFLYSSPIQVIPPPPDMEVDLNADAGKKLCRELQSNMPTKESIEELPHRFSRADKDGWLTIKINVNSGVPIEELLLVLGDLVKDNRYRPSTRRNRPDKDANALEIWECYEREKRFANVARNFARKVSTVKGQYIRACLLIYGEKPSGTMKQRRVGKIKDPAVWFQSHYVSCSRCQKADRAEDMCAAASAYANQDVKAQRERLDSNPM